MTLNEFKIFRVVLKPLLELKKWRREQQQKRINSICSCSICEMIELDREPYDSDKAFSAGIFGICFLLAGLIFVASCIHSTPAHAYTDEQYVNAIRHAEGIWTYGIKTVKCENEASCRRICLTTVSNNRKRYSRYGFRHYPSFTQFLGSRYCPTKSRSLTASEKRLNKYWVKNVTYFLQKDGA